MAVVHATGTALCRGHDTLNMMNPSGYFNSEIIRKLYGDKELQDWSAYRASDRRNRTMISGQLSPLAPPSGPAHEGGERRAAFRKSPMNTSCAKLRRGYNSNLGWKAAARRMAREFFKDYDALPYAMGIALVKRFGFKRRGKLADAKIREIIRDMWGFCTSETPGM